MVGRPINENLATAKLIGDKTYEGLEHAACGTNVRYTSGGGCVYCARTKQTQMRALHKALTQTPPAILTEPERSVIREPWD